MFIYRSPEMQTAERQGVQAERIFQSCLVWLIPLFGAFVVFLFHRIDRRRQGPEAQPMRLDGSEIDVGLFVSYGIVVRSDPPNSSRLPGFGTGSGTGFGAVKLRFPWRL
jgi:hypothetical protein